VEERDIAMSAIMRHTKEVPWMAGIAQLAVPLYLPSSYFSSSPFWPKTIC
jgi:hypothetical protein